MIRVKPHLVLPGFTIGLRHEDMRKSSMFNDFLFDRGEWLKRRGKATTCSQRFVMDLVLVERLLNEVQAESVSGYGSVCRGLARFLE